MSYEENYQHMIRRNKATGYAIYDCLLKAYRKHGCLRHYRPGYLPDQ